MIGIIVLKIILMRIPAVPRSDWTALHSLAASRSQVDYEGADIEQYNCRQ